MASLSDIYSYMIQSEDYPQIVPGLTIAFGGDGSHTYANLTITDDAGKLIEKPPGAAFQAVNELLETRANAINTQRQALATAYQNIVGKAVADLTTTELKTLLLALAYRAGAIDDEALTIRALPDWF